MYNNNYPNLISPQTPQQSNLENVLSNAAPALMVLIVLLVIILLAVAILVIVSKCKIFTKAGEKWWKAIIPFYSTWVNTKVVGLAWWWFLIFAGLTYLVGDGKSVSYVASTGLTLVSFNYNYNLAKKFGKTNGFAFLCTILPVIGLPILGLGSAKYNKDAKVDKNGIFSVEK